MSDTNTAYLQLVKPELDGSQHTWGNKLNSDFDIIDSLFPGGILAVSKGGTGAVDAPGARANLGIGTAALGNAANAAFTDLRVNGNLGVGTPSPTADVDVAGNLACTSLETAGNVQAVSYTLPSSFAHGSVSVTSVLRLSGTSRVKNSSGALVVAPTSIIELDSDMSYANNDVKSVLWSTKVLDELALSLSNGYITGITQGVYRVSLRYHFAGSNANFSLVGGRLVVSDSSDHDFYVPSTNVTANDLFTAVMFTFRAPNSGTNNSCRVVLWNYTGQTLTLKGSSSAQKARIILTRLS